MYQNICGRFGQQENIPELQTEFYNSKLRYGDNARDFYRDLQVIFNKLRKADPIIGEQGLRHQAVQALPLELEQTETEYNYDNFVDEIVRKYDIRIKLNPPIKNMSVNQTTLLDRANKHNDRNSPEKDQTSTNILLHRINIKFCSYCLEKRHKSPQTHTDNECGHLHPELKDKHMKNKQLNKFGRQRSINTPETKLSSQPQLSPANYRTLMTGRFPPDTTFFDQGSDVTCTCRLDLLTNIRQLNTPERFGTLSGKSNSPLVGTMQLNLGHKNGTINWIETEALLEKYKLYLYYKPPYIKLSIPHYRHDTHTKESVVQTSPNANTDDTPAPASFKTIYDRFDKQEEFPNEYLGFNHSSKRKAPPTRVKGTLIQPGQTKHAARVSKQQEDDRLNKAEGTKTGIHYHHLQEQWSQFNDDKKRIYPDPEFYLPPPGAQVRESNSYKESIKELW
ncbi:hypothetical protein E3Q17_04386 [Wallemia mellicola]|nr:hypothetical protein E3Q17_04386 [Wallemia mellicola]